MAYEIVPSKQSLPASANVPELTRLAHQVISDVFVNGERCVRQAEGEVDRIWSGSRVSEQTDAAFQERKDQYRKDIQTVNQIAAVICHQTLAGLGK